MTSILNPLIHSFERFVSFIRLQGQEWGTLPLHAWDEWIKDKLSIIEEIRRGYSGMRRR